jgi:putative CocE/NonD family hydrolase
MSRIVLLLLLALAPLLAQPEPGRARESYTKYEFRIPMRDGTHLYTSAYVPKDRSHSYPFLMQRTPYSCGPYGIDNYGLRLAPGDPLFASGYIFVCQDVRGRYQSEGVFTEMRPHGGAISESTDTYDTVEWLIKNVPGNNGRAGLYGISYPGFYAAAAIPGAHPALKAISPQAPMVDLFRGDDAFHNGAFMLAANFGFYRYFTEHKEPQTGRDERGAGFDFGTPNHYDFYLRLGPLANTEEKYFKFKNPYWSENIKHTRFDEYWQARDLAPHVAKAFAAPQAPAVLLVGGWFDAEDLQGPLRLKRAAGARPDVTLVMGPWVHGGWAYGDGSSLGAVQFQVKTGADFRTKIQAPFFEHFLKDAGDWKSPAARVFLTGLNEWREFDAWPPKTAETKTLYFQNGGALGFSAPPAPGGVDDYVSDPARPVPFMATIESGVPRTYMVADQRFAAMRPDVLVYQTEPLEEDLTLVGPLTARLWASTSATDSDWVVKLVDVYPNDAPNNGETKMGGYQQLLRGEPFRGRFWKSMEKPEPLPANQFVRIEYTLPDIFHTFRRGHRVMVQVQSSWFPLVDRNPQTFVESIPDAKAADFIRATQRVAHEPARPSGIEVRVLR